MKSTHSFMRVAPEVLLGLLGLSALVLGGCGGDGNSLAPLNPQGHGPLSPADAITLDLNKNPCGKVNHDTPTYRPDPNGGASILINGAFAQDTEVLYNVNRIDPVSGLLDSRPTAHGVAPGFSKSTSVFDVHIPEPLPPGKYIIALNGNKAPCSSVALGPSAPFTVK